ncbi:hypothetical protein DCC61_02855 [Candidatus Microgenomates bacterium]|nr:ComEC/Rec2 family competence protein [Candidatus Microgenomates bacterium CPR3]RIK51361.1 MAG: hypothetical protein DCC61_02855 [Candidatus Microgenomates bacterium]
MKRSKIIFVGIGLIIILRVISSTNQNKLAIGTNVILTIPTIDYPEYTDTQTIIRRGEWEARVKGYIDFIPGDTVEIEGVMDARGRVNSDQCSVIRDQDLWGIDWGLVQISKLRHWAVGRLQSVLPEPQASLAVGILLGVKRNMPRDFYAQLINTGTLHIVAASGYNVSVVSGAVIGGLAGLVGQRMGVLMGIVSIMIYVIMAGSNASIVRAGVMGGLSLIGIVLGRQRDARHLLWVAVFVMLMLKPKLITDVGFLLSVSATVGLLYFGEILKLQILRFSNWKWMQDYLAPTLAATFATLPVIWWFFGRVSLIGILVNMLILPIVPMIMLFSVLTIFVSPFSYLLYVPLWWMVLVIRWFGG